LPEFYSSIGEAIGAAMQHNIRSAYGDQASRSDEILQARHRPATTVDPSSVPEMTMRLTETASPEEVAGIIAKVNGALAGPLPQLTELVAAAADWTRARLDFDGPDHTPTFEVWQQLATATRMLQQAEQELAEVVEKVSACPPEPSDPRHHESVQALHRKELLPEVLDNPPVADTTSPDQDAQRQRTARATSPHASVRQVMPTPDPGAGPPSAKSPTQLPRTR
jgi:hypothetical protein